MNRSQLTRTTGIFFLALVIISNIPYILLIETFEYDDILRKPVDYVLTQFHNGGTGLILTWFAFGLTALLFILASLLLYKVMELQDSPYLYAATWDGNAFWDFASSGVDALGICDPNFGYHPGGSLGECGYEGSGGDRLSSGASIRRGRNRGAFETNSHPDRVYSLGSLDAISRHFSTPSSPETAGVPDHYYF